jgi:hypothetical protein
MPSKKLLLARLWLAALLAAPIVLWILPSDFFDNGEIITCPSRLFFDIECLGCGMTRAVMHMHHLEFADAMYYNTGVAVVFPALVLLWLYLVRKAAQNSGVLERLQGKFAR